MNQAIRERTKWFMDARFGMFIHWGIYAIPACGEWVMSQREMTNEEYEQYFREFDPTAYDPKEWAKLAKRAGMKYAVLTAKHHDGFCLFDSALTDYKATNTKAGRDLVREFLDAFRAEGIRVGLYFRDRLAPSRFSEVRRSPSPDEKSGEIQGCTDRL